MPKYEVLAESVIGGRLVPAGTILNEGGAEDYHPDRHGEAGANLRLIKDPLPKRRPSLPEPAGSGLALPDSGAVAEQVGQREILGGEGQA